MLSRCKGPELEYIRQRWRSLNCLSSVHLIEVIRYFPSIIALMFMLWIPIGLFSSVSSRSLSVRESDTSEWEMILMVNSCDVCKD